ncbi:hypothetical protein H7347_05445 [Corynebacterium sp. zg-331]|uniref:hypothetical protein n=1 Tax=unclassified Corynebacterium TaxID=2624378 RepID=UPI00128CA03D|nr:MULTISPECIES: hypothetical protein [unclassified Corynebacterium]MBC3186022.1 hypothetical protein [Corynebacterium sp. zg-331]MPV52513.1 hypothetical protein [Corynebacterium sp. zg331]
MTVRTWAAAAAAVMGFLLVADLASVIFLESGAGAVPRTLSLANAALMLMGIALFFVRRIPRAMMGVVLALGLCTWWARLAVGLGGGLNGEDAAAVLLLGGAGRVSWRCCGRGEKSRCRPNTKAMLTQGWENLGRLVG